MNVVLFELQDFTVYTFGVFVLLSVFLFYLVVRLIEGRWIQKESLHVLNIWWELLLAALIGGRLLEVAVNHLEYSYAPELLLRVWERPLSGVGAFIAMLFVVIFEMRHRKGLRAEALDVFITASFASMVPLYAGLWFAGQLDGGVVIPHLTYLPLYYAGFALVNFIVMCLMWIRDVRMGLIFSYGLFVYGIMMLFVDYLRLKDDVVYIFDSVPTMSVIGGLLCFAAVMFTLSKFITVTKVRHVVHHRYEEDV